MTTDVRIIVPTALRNPVAPSNPITVYPGVGSSVITGLQGSINVNDGSGYAHGDSYTLTGSGFEVQTPIAWDDMNWGSAGDNLEDSPNVSWVTTNSNGPDDPEISTAQAYGQYTRSGSHNNDVAGDSAAMLTNLNLTEIYVSFMYRYRTTGSPVSGKGWRIHVDDGPNIYSSAPGFADQDHQDSDARLENNYTDDFNGITNYYVGELSEDTWHRLEYWVTLSTAGVADGRITYWRDYNLSKNETSIISRASGITDVWQRAMMPFFYATGGAGTGWYNDVWWSNTPARVEIGNNATWANCTIREIQGLNGSPSSTSIPIKINKGTLSSGTNYLFTVDADGTATYYGEIELE